MTSIRCACGHNYYSHLHHCPNCGRLTPQNKVGNRAELQAADVLCRFKIQNRTADKLGSAAPTLGARSESRACAEIRALGNKYFLVQGALFIDCGQNAALVFEVISRLENNKKLPKEAVLL